MNKSIFMGFILSTILSCSKYDPDCGNSSIPQFSNLYLKVPYTINDTLHFTDTIGNELRFILTELESGFVDEINNSNPDCGAFTIKMQYTKYHFIETNNNARLWIGNFMKSDTLFLEGAQTLQICINTVNYEFFSSAINQKSLTIKERELNSVKYYDLSYPEHTSNPNAELFYTKDLGIIYFKSDSIKWYLKR